MKLETSLNKFRISSNGGIYLCNETLEILKSKEFLAGLTSHLFREGSVPQS
jgi:hypothetical protein